MPYIEQKRRDAIAAGSQPRSSGELNYRFTQVAFDYLAELGTSYTKMNDIIGALEACKLEFYRRVVVPYEECKRATNGDVYEP